MCSCISLQVNQRMENELKLISNVTNFKAGRTKRYLIHILNKILDILIQTKNGKRMA